MIVNDHWTLELGALGMRDSGEELARAALRCRPPFAVGVFGKWGSGKTSLMRYAMARLGGAPLAVTLRSAPERPLTELPVAVQLSWSSLKAGADDFVLETFGERDPEGGLDPADVRVLPIWFNPWLHQGSASPLVPLLHELAAQGTAFQRGLDSARRIGATALESAVDLLFGLAEAAAAMAGVPGGGLAEVPDRVRKYAADYGRERMQAASEVQRFNLLFEAAVARLLGEDIDGDGGGYRDLATRRLVIFVDDLDRCEERQVVRLLEAIKLYLQTRNCVFVLGLDESAVRRAVVRQWRGRSDQEAQDYLDKLFQAVVYVPAGRSYDRFVEDLLARWGVGEGLGECAGLINRLVERNPRKVKNFVNGLMLAWRVGGSGRPAAPGLPFVLWHYLRVYHPDVSRLIQHDRSYLSNLNRVLSELDLLDRESASPVDIFMARDFRHAFEAVRLEGGGTAVAEELLQRLDRHRGDQNFLRAWEGRYLRRPAPGEQALLPSQDPELLAAIAGRAGGE